MFSVRIVKKTKLAGCEGIPVPHDKIIIVTPKQDYSYLLLFGLYKIEEKETKN